MFSLHHELFLEKSEGHLPLQVQLYLRPQITFQMPVLPVRGGRDSTKMLASACGPELAI